jgi:hypothetical protein
VLQPQRRIAMSCAEFCIENAHQLRRTHILHLPQARDHSTGAAALHQRTQPFYFPAVIRSGAPHARFACRQSHEVNRVKVKRADGVQGKHGAISQ